MNDPLYNHTVFGKDKGKGGNIGKSDEKLIADLISIHNAENWLGMDGETETSMFNKSDLGGDSNITDLKEGRPFEFMQRIDNFCFNIISRIILTS